MDSLDALHSNIAGPDAHIRLTSSPEDAEPRDRFYSAHRKSRVLKPLRMLPSKTWKNSKYSSQEDLGVREIQIFSWIKEAITSG